MTQHYSRRSFLGMASGAVTAPAMTGFSAMQGSEGEKQRRYDLESLVGVILDTPRNRCVEVLGEQLRRGTSYRHFLAGLFHASARYGGDHEIAMMYAASRVSGELSINESPLLLFWAFDALARQYDKNRVAERSETFPPLASIPPAGKALGILHDAIEAQDRGAAEPAAVSLARSIGSRQTLELIWRYACRDHDNLGHKAIVCANTWRVLDRVGWEHAEIPLRKVLLGIAGGGDRTYNGNQKRMERTLPKLPPDWCSSESDHKATLELHEEIRSARTTAATDLVCEQLLSGKVKSGSVWDAIHLSAAELLVRYKYRTRGFAVHAVTSSNALHFAFRTVLDTETRLLLLLQATSRLSDQMTRLALKSGSLRDIHIRSLEPVEIRVQPLDTIDEIFALLPPKDPDRRKEDGYLTKDRDSDDKACQMAFALLENSDNRVPFIRATCEHLSHKGSWNAHDMKFPAAAMEDVGFISERWRPHVLASTVHAIHGPQSPDTPVFKEAREILATL